MGNHLALRLASALAIVTLVSTVGCSDVTQPTTEAQITAPTTLLASLTGGTGTSSTITSRVSGSPCVTVVNESNAAGTAVQIWNCYGSPAQAFSWMADGSIRAFASTTPMCLGTTGTGTDGDRIVIQACNGSSQQKWTASASNEIKGINGKCLDIVNASSANGARLMLWNCYGSSSQKWDNVAGSGGAAPSSPPPSSPAAGGDGQRVAQRLDIDGEANRTGDGHAARRVRQRLDRTDHRVELFELRGGECSPLPGS
jgi:hypothetical protein